ncbi:unnamed protein product [Malus baccata var. baccata]
MLSSASDAFAAVFDVQCGTDKVGGGAVTRHNVLQYPVNTGLFVTGSYDHHINVWDTNTTQVVTDFKMSGKMYRTAMSPLATSHMLIAAGTEDVQVLLCDIASGAFTHTLSGHRNGVMAVEWSTSSERALLTGGCDGAIRFWDIRRAGFFLVLDQSQSQLGRRPPILKRSATVKVFFFSWLSQKSLVPTVKSSSPSHSTSAKARVAQRKLTNGSGAKHSPIGKGPVKGSMKQILHPGMLSSQDRATAHYGAVTGLKVTEDGMYLLSAGSDSRLRLWDIESGCNTLNFETLATSQNSELVFVPYMTAVKVMHPFHFVLRASDTWSGKTSLKGHYEHVNCCWFSSQDQELYTGGDDRQILVWSPPRMVSNEDEDNWSD